MKVSIDRNSLVEIVLAAAAATEDAPYLKLTAEGHSLACEGVSPELAARLRAPAGVEREGSIAVAGRILSRLAIHLPEGGIELEAEYPYLTVRFEGGSATLAGADPLVVADFPAPPQELAPLPPGSLALLLAQVMFAAAREGDGRPALTGIRLETKGGRLYAVATDGHRLATASLPWEGRAAATITRRVAALLRELSRRDPEGRLGISPGRIFYDSAAAQVAAPLIAYPYPDVWKVMEEMPRGGAITLPREELLSAVARAEAIVPRGGHIGLSLGHHGLAVAAAAEEGSVQTLLPGERSGTGNGLSCRVQPSFLSRPLRALPPQAEEVSLTITGSATALRLSAAAGDLQVEHIIMPVLVT
jgi:DNA polymerase-3 subunit beta